MDLVESGFWLIRNADETKGIAFEQAEKKAACSRKMKKKKNLHFPLLMRIKETK